MKKWIHYFSWIKWLKWPRRFITISIWLVLIGFNILTLTSSAIYAAASSAMAAIGVRNTSRSVLMNQVNSLQGRVTAQRNAVRRMGSRLTTRTTTVAARKVASMPAKAIPMAGIAILVGGTVWEISMLCEGLEDLNVLYTDFEIDDASALTAMSTVCNPEIPTVSDLRDYVFGADLPEDPDA